MKKLLVAVSTITAAAVLLFSQQVSAAAGPNYNQIISDAIFDNVSSMSAAQIDSFLNKQPNSCLSAKNGYSFADPTGYTPSGGFTYGSNVSAGTAIRHAAQAYGINPQVLLTTIQKEQGLVQGNGPYGCSALAFSAALGYSCTDSEDPDNDYSNIQMYVKNGTEVKSVNNTCVPNGAYVGFSRQLINAAWLLSFDRHRAEGHNNGQGNWYINKPNWDNSDDLGFCYSGPTAEGTFAVCPSGSTAYYDGYISIDGTALHMDNGATAALYHYTPHKHGQYLFFTIFSNWFGNPNFVPLDTPRWMQTKSTLQKTDLSTYSPTGSSIPANTPLKFTTKVYVNGQWYLRTEYDTAHDGNTGIPQSSLMEVPYVSVGTPRWMQLERNITKVDPRTGKSTGQTCASGTQIYFDTKIQINGVWYLRSQYDTSHDSSAAVPASSVEDISYTSLENPRWLIANQSTVKVNPQTGATTTQSVAKNAQIFIDNKIFINGSWYFRAKTDTDNSQPLAIRADKLDDIAYVGITPKWQRLSSAAYKVNPRTGQQLGGQIPSGTQLKFSSKMYVNGQWYLRTEYDTAHQALTGILASSIQDIPYVSLETPRKLKLTAPTSKISPSTGQATSAPFATGTEIYFDTKIEINGVWYLRSQYDTSHSYDSALPQSRLKG